jgi:hypothetical protein
MFIPDPDPTFFHPGSRIRIKEFKYFNPKKKQKMVLSSRKYDPGCSSRIPDPGSGSESATLEETMKHDSETEHKLQSQYLSYLIHHFLTFDY